jgi:hypothetical protein
MEKSSFTLKIGMKQTLNKLNYLRENVHLQNSDLIKHNKINKYSVMCCNLNKQMLEMQSKTLFAKIKF